MATAQTFSVSAREALTLRLTALKALREQAKSDTAPSETSGDAADRVENVEALIRLEDLDSKIASLEVTLQSNRVEDLINESSANRSVPIGSRVHIRFGTDEDTETFVIGPVEMASAGVDVITPSSPLGAALLDASPGDTVQYRAAGGSRLSATLVSIG
jgi:transcription elongation factor GreA